MGKLQPEFRSSSGLQHCLGDRYVIPPGHYSRLGQLFLNLNTKMWVHRDCSPKVPKGVSSKLFTHWKGPYQIMEQTGPLNYKIRVELKVVFEASLRRRSGGTVLSRRGGAGAPEVYSVHITMMIETLNRPGHCQLKLNCNFRRQYFFPRRRQSPQVNVAFPLGNHQALSDVSAEQFCIGFAGPHICTVFGYELIQRHRLRVEMGPSPL
eukprot:g61783.t1